MTKVKICGVRRVEDARAVIAAKADAIGLNFYPKSSRFIGDASDAKALIDAAGASSIAWAGVFVNATLEQISETVRVAGLSIVQLHGDEEPEFLTALRPQLPPRVAIWKAFPVSSADDFAGIARFDCAVRLLDTKTDQRGGSGRTFDWSLIKEAKLQRPFALAGGLTPENVAEAIRSAEPEWVDTASGVESAPGIKDSVQIEKFVRLAKMHK